MSSCSACPAPAIPCKGLRNHSPEPWAAGFPLDWGALLQQIQLFNGISVNYCTGLRPNFVHLCLREGKKNKKAAK